MQATKRTKSFNEKQIVLLDSTDVLSRKFLFLIMIVLVVAMKFFLLGRDMRVGKKSRKQVTTQPKAQTHPDCMTSLNNQNVCSKGKEEKGFISKGGSDTCYLFSLFQSQDKHSGINWDYLVSAFTWFYYIFIRKTSKLCVN